jgi:hypothetical protein
VKVALVLYFCACLSLAAWLTAKAPQPQTAYAIVNQRNNFIIVDWPNDTTPPVGPIKQLNIFPDKASAVSKMVEWNDAKIDTSHFKIVPVTVTTTP